MNTHGEILINRVMFGLVCAGLCLVAAWALAEAVCV